MAVINKKALPLAPLSSGIMLRRAAERSEAKQASLNWISCVVLASLDARFADSPTEFGLVLSVRHVNVEIERNHR